MCCSTGKLNTSDVSPRHNSWAESYVGLAWSGVSINMFIKVCGNRAEDCHVKWQGLCESNPAMSLKFMRWTSLDAIFLPTPIFLSVLPLCPTQSSPNWHGIRYAPGILRYNPFLVDLSICSYPHWDIHFSDILFRRNTPMLQMNVTINQHKISSARMRLHVSANNN
jgi:hypothetical protein